MKKKLHTYLKFFIIGNSHRRKGIATNLLTDLYKRFKELGYKGERYTMATEPDYWFSGINPKFTARFFS